ncbi:MAG: DegV family protein [Clostridia bacterium]|nr:DegV family protein [Clostridia bacterium]
MADYILSCCSTADLTKEEFEARDIHYVCFHYFLDDVEHPDDLYETMDADTFYQKMADGAMTRTSQVNVEEFIDYFTPFLEAGKDILHVTLSSGLSGVYNSACTARSFLLEKDPERRIFIIDSLGASSGYGLFMDTLADKRDAGMSLDDLAAWAEQNRLRLHHWFFSTDLTFYVRGGRISRASGWFGTVLKICPLLNMDDTGHLVPRYKVRGKKAVIEEIVQKMAGHAENGTDYTGKVFLSMSACPEDAQAVADLVAKTFPHMDGKPIIHNIGTTIGAHTGPGTVALFFWGDERTE